MSLSGQLSDLSLAELIEFFCNQNKTGRLKIAYNRGPGYFYFQNGALVDAKLGVLTGVDAVYYALTLENASFKFSTAFPPMNRSIQQPWAQVALEGLRRMDEGIAPEEAFPEGFIETDLEPDDAADEESGTGQGKKRAASAGADSMSLSLGAEENAGASRNKTFVIAGVAAAVIIMIAAIGVPAGWYSSKKPVDNITQTPPANPSTPENNQAVTTQPTQNATATPTPQQAQPTKPDPVADAKRELERKAKEERERKAREEAKRTSTPEPVAAAPKAKTVTVTVTVDAAGHVTSVSGGDPVAQRIARQRRFPPNQPKTTTVSIPVN